MKNKGKNNKGLNRDRDQVTLQLSLAQANFIYTALSRCMLNDLDSLNKATVMKDKIRMATDKVIQRIMSREEQKKNNK